MFGVVHYSTFAVGALLIVLLPGPNSMYVLSVAARRGVRTGFRSACGVFVGDTTLIVLTSLGAASLLEATPIVFDAVKLIGAGYLIYIGYGMLRSARQMWRERKAGPDVQEPAGPVDERERPFRRAVVISLLNPKAILFLLSFFVQFVDPGYGQTALSFTILGATLQLCSVLYLTTLILAGTALANAFRRRRRLSAALTTGVAALFIGFAAKLATASTG